MDTFLKPFSEEIFKTSSKICRYPYTNEFLKSQPIFPLLVFDGGAFFMIKELMGSKDPYSRELFEFISSGELFNNWQIDGHFDWDTSYKLSRGSKLPISAEYHVWINRLYFLLPIAQEFLLTGNEEWAQEWIKWLNDWLDSHPYQELDDRPHSQTDYVWRDMQVAWRLLVIMHSIKMLASSSTIGKRDWKTIYTCVRKHAAHLYKEGLGHIESSRAHNHILQIGLVLLMTGVLFPEFEDSDRYETAGRRIIEINMKKQLFDDGGSKEGCPSYSHFIARMYLEVYLLLEKNSLPTISGLEECIKKQYTWLYQMTPPTGKTLQIGDSYALDAERDIATAASVMELNLPNERCSVLFEESRFAALRNERFDVFIDAMDRTQGHQHFGRPHITAFCEKKPLLIDTGCCVYDRKDFRNFLMSAEAHNTILITSPDTGAILSDSTNTSIDVTGFDMVGENQQIVLETKGEGFAWKRMMSIEGKRLKIYDSVNSDTPLVCTLMLHFAPTKATLVSSCEAALFLKDKDIKITLDSGSEGFKMEVHPAMDDQNGFFYSTVLSTKAEGTRVEFCILLE